MSELRVKVLATLLEQDSFFTWYGLKHDYQKFFGVLEDDEPFKKVVSGFQNSDVIIAFDLQEDGLGGALLDHNEHGSLNASDIMVVGDDEFLALGPAYAIELYADTSAVAEAAAEGGCREALRLIKLLPIDSSKWTGVRPTLVFDDKVKSKVLDLLKKADHEMDGMFLSNVDHSQARALLKAALILAEAPNPDPVLISTIVRRLGEIIGFTSAVLGILSFFR
ncbi:hypothetical protein ACKU27_12510 [Sphingobium yanoikuyae]|uniref:hypothetical protein n=1 Tax=Sphingobium yanoikuyae TaxID=13690 RepID=UPI002FDD9E80